MPNEVDRELLVVVARHHVNNEALTELGVETPLARLVGRQRCDRGRLVELRSDRAAWRALSSSPALPRSTQ
jgi:hypothetical protein